MRSAAFILALLLLAGCGTTAAPGGRESLDGRTFLSTAVTEDSRPRELVPDTRIRVGFADGQLTASAGCNTMGAAYRVDDDDALVVEALRTTLIGCPEALAAQDAWLSDLLESRPTLRLEGDELTLTGATTTILLLDRAVAAPDRPLVGTEWRVHSLISAEAVSSTPEGAEAGLRFDDDGSVVVHPGCNTGRGTYVTGPGTVTISGIVLTRMACQGERGELERAVLEVLEAPGLTVEIEAATLTLMAGEKGLVLRAE